MATKKYLRKIIGDENSVFEAAESDYIEARRTKAFDEYWAVQLTKLPEQITTLFQELVNKSKDLDTLNGRLAEFRDITNLINLLHYLLNSLSARPKETTKESYDDPFLDEFRYDEDWFFEEEELTDIFWDEIPSITFKDFNRLIKFNAANIFEDRLYLSKRWHQLSEEILVIIEGNKDYEKFSKGKKTKAKFANFLKRAISKNFKKDSLEKSNFEDNLEFFIVQFNIAFEQISTDDLMEKFFGENLTIEIKKQSPDVNKIVELKSEIIRLRSEIDDLVDNKIKDKISLHILILMEQDAARAENEDNAKSVWELKTLFKNLKEIENKNPSLKLPVNSLSVENTYQSLLADQTEMHAHVPDAASIQMAERIAYNIQSDNKRLHKFELANAKKTGFYPIQSDPPKPPVGLTHSGGGRRAEIYNLGIQQELARLGALPWFDYLSTVSGGGWTGVNMISLLSGKPNNGDYFFNTQWEKYPYNPGIKIFKLPQDPKEIKKPNPKTRWIEDVVSYEEGQNTQLKYLRDKGNYLAPRQGWINRDALRVSGWIVSSLLMNILMFLIILLMVSSSHYLLNLAFSPEISNTYYIFENCTPGEEGCFEKPLTAEDCPPGSRCFQTDEVGKAILEWDDTWGIYIGLGVTSLLVSLALIAVIKYSYKKFDHKYKNIFDPLKWKASYSRYFLVLLLLPLLYALNSQARTFEQTEWFFVVVLGFLFLLFLRRRKFWKAPSEDGRSKEEDIDTYLLENLAIFSFAFPIFMIAFSKWALISSGLLKPEPDSLQIYWVLMPLVISLGAGLGLWAYLIFHDKKPFGESRFRTIFWAYLGYHNIYLIVIAVFTGISVSLFFSQINVDGEGNRFIIPVSTALLSAISTGIMAYTKDKGKMDSLTSSFKAIAKFSAGLRNYLLGFLVILLNVSIIYIFESLLDQHVTGRNTVVYIAAGSFLLFLILSRFVNFNNMSLHYFWRDRTEEAFLKTEMMSEKGEVISVRDDRNLLMGHHINEINCSAPYHLIITAVNLQGSWRFDVKDRKSQHFIFSRNYTGSDITGYVKTSLFRIGKDEDGNYRGMTKYSKAMAISAAAFASALGDQSFFAEGFAMTLFNIRLGWWMLNPKLYDPKIDITNKFPVAKKIFNNKPIDEKMFYSKLEDKSKGKSTWAPYIFDEALSLASERRELVNLSDGGHTGDNPGVYPLLQRRCKIILVGDASFDPTSQCEQFMNALLYAKNDMGIDVDIDLAGLYPATADNDVQKKGMSKNHCAVGKISYPAIRDASDETKLPYPEETGWIIYLKTTITPDDPSQLQQYWMGHKEMFPQPSTLDQFFEEDQYEAQRLLGEVSVRKPLKKLEKYYQAQIKEIKDTTEKGRATFKLGLVQHVLKRNPDFTELKKNFNEMMADLQKALMQ